MSSLSDNPNITKEQWAYIAGFVDGDGCIWQGEVEGYVAGSVSIAQKHRAVLDEIQQIVGTGAIHWSADKYEGMHGLAWQGRQAREVAKELYPHLWMKKHKAASLALVVTAPDIRSNKPAIELAETDKSISCFWAYVAGMVDSDGSIGIYDQLVAGRYYPTARLGINQKNREYLEKLREAIGFGAVCRRGTSGKNGDPMHYLIFGPAQSRRVCDEIIPYLRIKQDIARTVSAIVPKVPLNSVTAERPEVIEALRLYDEGHSNSEVGKLLDVKPMTVAYWVRQNGKARSLEESQQLRRAKEKRTVAA